MHHGSVIGYSESNREQIRKPMMVSGLNRERDEESDAGWAAGTKGDRRGRGSAALVTRYYVSGGGRRLGRSIVSAWGMAFHSRVQCRRPR
jgi:hypothetical protein